MRVALRAREADDQHVLGKPTLVAGLIARDAQRMTLFAEQRVAAVTAAEALDREILGKMHDEASIRVEFAGRVQTFDEAVFAADALECGAPRTRHQHHVDDDVCTVGDLDAAAGVGRVDRAHAVGHDVQGATLHAAAEQPAHFRARFGGRHPMIVGAGVLLLRGADEGQVLDAGDVRGMRTREKAIRVMGLVELLQFAALLQLTNEMSVFVIGAFDPVNLVRLRQFAHGRHPLGDLFRECRQRRHGCCGGSHSGCPYSSIFWKGREYNDLILQRPRALSGSVREAGLV